MNEYTGVITVSFEIKARDKDDLKREIEKKLGKELMSRDEIAVLDGSKCVLQLRGVRPFLSDKYDLTQHPNYKYTADFDKRYTFDIEKFLNHRMRLKTNDEYEVVEADESEEQEAAD